MTEVKPVAVVMMATAPGRKPTAHVVDADYCDELIAALQQAKAVCVAGQAALDGILSPGDVPAQAGPAPDDAHLGKLAHREPDSIGADAEFLPEQPHVDAGTGRVRAILDALFDGANHDRPRPRVIHHASTVPMPPWADHRESWDPSGTHLDTRLCTGVVSPVRARPASRHKVAGRAPADAPPVLPRAGGR